mgnify:CR=1 FL=1
MKTTCVEIARKAFESEYVKQNPYIDDTGIYVPLQEYIPRNFGSCYRLLISKEMFIEAYNKWIKPTEDIVRCAECKYRGTTACMMYHEYWLDTFDEPCYSDYTHDDGYCHGGERLSEDGQ